MYVKIDELQSLHRFGDVFEEAAKQLDSDLYQTEVLRNAPDAIGQHWYGMRLKVKSKLSGREFYFHTGLIYLPITEIGLMFEIDKQNNQTVYDRLRNNLETNHQFDVIKIEEDYLKLFMKKEDFEKLNASSTSQQLELLKEYLNSCIEAVVEEEANYRFIITRELLDNTYLVAKTIQTVIENHSGETYTVEVNQKDPDNYGQYAMGYRYYLTASKSQTRIYAYFGIIYSYKKNPAGVFAEIDHFSNQDCFDHVKNNLEVSNDIYYSDKEEKFIKLFMKDEDVEKLNSLENDKQIEFLNDFLGKCNRILCEAADK